MTRMLWYKRGMTDRETSPTKDENEPAEPSENQPPLVIGMPSLSRILSIVMIILGIIVVGVLFFQVMVGFFVPLFLAALLVVIFRPVHVWIVRRTRYRRRIAATATTSLILLVVLLPIIVVISVAASQFTSTIGQLDPQRLTERLDDARQQLGLSLIHPEKFRRLDRLAESLDTTIYSDETQNTAEILDGVDVDQLLQRIGEARTLILYLAEQIRQPVGDDPIGNDALANDPLANDPSPDRDRANKRSLDAGSDPDPRIFEPEQNVIERLDWFAEVVQTTQQTEDRTPLDQIVAREQYHRQSVIASASIRTWIRDALGGTLRSQLRLLANPSAEDFKDLLGRARGSLQPRFVSLTSRTSGYVVKFLIDLVVLVIAVYFFLIDGNKMTRTLMRLSPLDDEYEEQLLSEFDRTSRAVVLASVASALAQGLLAALAFWFLNLPSIVLLFLLTSLLALVPFLGAASVWVPCAIYLAAVDQRFGAAFGLAVFGAAIISSIDNVIKMYVLQGRSTLHPLFALLSVLGGVSVFGPIGIIVGPMVVVFLQTLLEILNHELTNADAADANSPSPVSRSQPN